MHWSRHCLPLSLIVIAPTSCATSSSPPGPPPSSRAATSTATTTASVMAQDLLARLAAKDWWGAAQLFHEPPSYTANEADQDRLTIAHWLDAVVSELGPLSELGQPTGPLQMQTASIAGGDEAYWEDKEVQASLVYQVRFAHDGPGYLMVLFCFLNGSLEVRSVVFGLPDSRPDAAERLASITARVQ